MFGFGFLMSLVSNVFKIMLRIMEKGLLFPIAIVIVGVISARNIQEYGIIHGSSFLAVIGFHMLALLALVAAIIIAILVYVVHQRFKGLADGTYSSNDVSTLGDLVELFFGIRLPSKQKKTLPKNKIRKLPKNKNKKQADKLHGVIFGKKDRRYINKSEETDGHILVVGGVGTGKSSCIAIPTLRAWNESVFAIDIKGELYDKTKEHRGNIKVFDPFDENSCGYDPFFCLRSSRNPAQEARAIAQAIIPLPLDAKDPFWIESAQNIFAAAILHYSTQGETFVGTIDKIQSTTPKDLIKELCESSARETRYFVNSFAGMEDKTLFSILAELSKNIVHFVTDRNLISALSRKNNITPDDLEFGNDVYIKVPEHLLKQWRTLLTLIVNQFLTHFEQRSETNARPILFLLDEFPRLGKINAMLDGLATLRSKKISICLIIQSLAQLDTIYGQNERKVIADTCAFKAVLGATDADTQEYFSKLAGTYDKPIRSKTTSPSGGLGSLLGTLGTPNPSISIQEQERRIIKPHEFGILNDIVLFIPTGTTLRVMKSGALGKDNTPEIFSIIAGEEHRRVIVPFIRVDKVPYYLEDKR